MRDVEQKNCNITKLANSKYRTCRYLVRKTGIKVQVLLFLKLIFYLHTNNLQYQHEKFITFLLIDHHLAVQSVNGSYVVSMAPSASWKNRSHGHVKASRARYSHACLDSLMYQKNHLSPSNNLIISFLNKVSNSYMHLSCRIVVS